MNCATSRTRRSVPDGLLAARDHVLDELRRADTKATTLLSLVGAALAGVIALTGRSLPAPAMVGLGVAGAILLAVVVLLLRVIRPRLNDRDPIPGSWVHAAHIDPTELTTASPPKSVDWPGSPEPSTSGSRGPSPCWSPGSWCSRPHSSSLPSPGSGRQQHHTNQ